MSDGFGHSGQRVIAYIDGGSRGNPGLAGYGVRLETMDGRGLAEFGQVIGEATCNQAEWRGLIAALAWAVEHGMRDVTVRSDSQLIVYQMQGRWRVKNVGLQPLYDEAVLWARRCDRVKMEWVPREKNYHADRIANLVMDAAERQEDEALSHGRDTKQCDLVPGPRHLWIAEWCAGESPSKKPHVTDRADPSS